MIGRRVTSFVKWILCKIILVISQRQAHFRQFNGTLATLTQMKTLHFISLNNCFVSIHIVVRFTHANRDIVADKDYAICIQIPGLFRCQRLKNVFLTLHVLRNRWFINRFKTDKKTFATEYW